MLELVTFGVARLDRHKAEVEPTLPRWNTPSNLGLDPLL